MKNLVSCNSSTVEAFKALGEFIIYQRKRRSDFNSLFNKSDEELASMGIERADLGSILVGEPLKNKE